MDCSYRPPTILGSHSRNILSSYATAIHGSNRTSAKVFAPKPGVDIISQSWISRLVSGTLPRMANSKWPPLFLLEWTFSMDQVFCRHYLLNLPVIWSNFCSEQHWEKRKAHFLLCLKSLGFFPSKQQKEGNMTNTSFRGFIIMVLYHHGRKDGSKQVGCWRSS